MGMEPGDGAGGVGAGDGEPARKRARLAPAADLRARLLDHKEQRLNHINDRLTEQLRELYFLRAGGNMTEYLAWRRRPPAPPLQAFLEARAPSSAPPPAPAATATVPAAGAPGSGAEETVCLAVREARVSLRVGELARAGLWPERRLPRVLEPPRAKTHWDYLLEEMTWLAADAAHERKWKKQAAKKCARAVQKYFQDKAQAAQKAEKAQEIHLKKLAAFAAKEIRTFWANVEKVVEWKRGRRVERARKEALEEQLSYMVDRSERYSRQLAAGLLAAPTAPTPPSDDEFRPPTAASDDETTIAAAERRDPPRDPRRELAELRRDSRTALADLLPPGYKADPAAAAAAHSDYAASDDDSADDEETIAEQERGERAQDVAAELDALRDEAELDLAALVRKYGGGAGEPAPSPRTTDLDSDDESESEASSSSSSGESGRLSELVEEAEGRAPESGEAEEEVEALAAAAARLQPTGTTLAATAVGTPVPALLRHQLREYQHVGLHWLATMHARRLNGILADEMGLGKTIQTIALLAHLALEKQDWGPHLVVAPTSVVLNWEMEFKKWCPAFKILTYYGTIKERKLKRVGWTKPNSFHVCITSYKLVVQDHQSFRRKRWKYLILDEAQNIKNFKSQRWQVLLNFQTERRLLLTGTPLQNSVLELWSLMHFLMPCVFASHSEFREWFTPLAALAEGGAGAGGAALAPDADDGLVRRLHGVLRPFLLRRLKADVERQLPRKHEHVLLCRLAKRQRALYDDFMSRAKTKECLSSGNLLSVINVLMQLRKVCNHPDLFEPRPQTSPFLVEPLVIAMPRLVVECVSPVSAGAVGTGMGLATLECSGAEALPAHRARHLAPARRALEQPPPAPPPPAPAARLRLHLRLVPRAPHRDHGRPAPPLHLATGPAPAPAPHANHPAAAAAPTPPATTESCHNSYSEDTSKSLSAERLEARRRSNLRRLAGINERRSWQLPLYGADLRVALRAPPPALPASLAPPSLEELAARLQPLLERFALCVQRARAPPPRLPARAAPPPRAPPALARLHAALHLPLLKQAVNFPHPDLIQYDCGKLQTLDVLMRRLKAGNHRVLIFTQMTRMLDVLERFLSLHGHTYLRLDGATKVERRQVVVDRFNSERRIFALILSTRAGGVGLNLTGADTVVFYDSDWNPTMDAQAQDRCHRIGQTRDVHVYRLVTRRTVEENILRKADQKRALSHLAIEHGRFTAANLADIIGADAATAAAAATDAPPAPQAPPADFESALAAAEDEADAAAAVAARAEIAQDEDEFDETARPRDPPAPSAPAPAPATATPAETEDPEELEFSTLMKQLSGVERYAMRVVESGSAELERAELEAVRARLREWEAARRELRSPPPAPAPPAPASPPLTYCRADARLQVWESANGAESMPVWSPPTPPWGAGDVYVEQWSRALYRRGAAGEAPAARPAPRRPPAAGPAPAPPGLFARAPRRHAHPLAPAPPAAHLASALEWSAAEDAALRRALRLQRLPPEPPLALTPNWEWCADLVGELRRAYRPPRACRDRHERLADPARRRAPRRPPRAPLASPRRRDDEAPRPPMALLAAMREAAERRRAAPRRRYDEPRAHEDRHAALLADHNLDYEHPPTPMEVAERRADRIAREKLKQGAAAAAPAPAPAAAAAGVPRLVVAGGGGAGGAARRDAALQLYRQQALARQHLKILHHPAQGVAAGVVSAAGAAGGAVGVVGAGGEALRALQLGVRRAAPPPGPLPPAPAPAPPSAPPAAPHAAPPQ